MEAIIEANGQQLVVKAGQKIIINKLDAEVGKDVNFDVLAILGDNPQFGQPTVAGAKVVATVLGHERGDKITVATYKRRKGFHKKHGHRQELTKLEIKSVK